jgi:exosortase/archaeosortase family protein
MKSLHKNSPLRFILIFLTLFLVIYYFNVVVYGLTSRGNHYSAFLDEHFNYIRLLRHFLLKVTQHIVTWFGFTSITNDLQLLVAGRGTLYMGYDCLGFGVMSFFSAFVIAYPKRLKSKLLFLVAGLLCIQLLNIVRLVVLALFWDKRPGTILDHHTIFNIIIYIIIAISIYFWVKRDDNQPESGAKD